ncbi:putative phospholipid-binding protein MlaC [Pandoraea iniqua]|uniref:Putative phospholipid-binding protein MlaC n=1 Tax=Pandoraea iniqua TaxID=2508288 RepID=A0A5E4Z6F8_9BURK|nr:ABC transporter substrate-binding protein [Pandoraea iniqua]VVE56654.1 putative phospholipid-binding protein MlaC [Pandoraea iniqua]VVE58824.1 putative phospholipid-binding protein MlaC [Pandoraea iniqua]
MKKFWLIPVMAFMTLTAAGSAMAQAQAPDALVKQTVSEVMAAAKTDPNIQRGDLNSITKLIETKIMPHADFAKTTQLATGPAWRNATPQQREQLTTEFKKLLLYTYAGAIAQIRDQQVEYKPFRAQPGDTDVAVNTSVLNNGQPIELDYRLYKTASGEWKLYDLNVLGAWLIQTYKTQFSEKINQSGVDGLIKFLTERNKQLSGGK